MFQEIPSLKKKTKKKKNNGPLRVKKKSPTGLAYLKHQLLSTIGKRVSVAVRIFIRLQHIYFIILTNRFEAGSCISLDI